MSAPRISLGTLLAGLMVVSVALPSCAQVVPPLFEGQGGFRWQYHTGGPVRGTPVVSGSNVVVGSDDGFLYAINRAGGTLVWRRALGSPVSGSPIAAAGLILVTTFDGRVVAVNGRNGTPRWSYQFGPRLPANIATLGGWDYLMPSPVVIGQQVVVGGQDGRVVALALATGALRWKAQTGGKVRGTPAVADGRVVVGSWDGAVRSFDLRTGAVQWTFRTAGDTIDLAREGYDRRAVQAPPVIATGTVFVGSRDDGVYAIDLATGVQKWRISHDGSWIVGAPLVADNRVYVGSSDAQFVQALDSATGRELWHVGLDANVLAAPVRAGNSLLVVTHHTDAPRGDLVALDPSTGKEQWRLRLDEASTGAPAVIQQEIYVATAAGTVAAVEATGRPSPRLAVYYDQQSPLQSFVPGAHLAAGYFGDLGYEVLNDSALAHFLVQRIADRLPSAVVWSADVVPPAVTAQDGDSTLFLRYLAAGGKIVAMGVPLGGLVHHPDGRVRGRSFKNAGALLGVATTGMEYEQAGAVPTSEGKRWGITATFRGDYNLPAERASIVLARDPEGFATAWVKQYRREIPGSGYVQLWGFGATLERLPHVRRVAEYGLLHSAIQQQRVGPSP